MSDKAKTEMIASVSGTHTMQVDADKYQAMRDAILQVLPSAEPGLTAAEMMAAVLPLLPDTLFPGGAKAGWWMKGVQLDLEARKAITRESTKPLRFHKIG